MKQLGHSYLEHENSELHLFRDRKPGSLQFGARKNVSAIWSQKIVSYSNLEHEKMDNCYLESENWLTYLKRENTVLHLFRAHKHWNIAISSPKKLGRSYFKPENTSS